MIVNISQTMTFTGGGIGLRRNLNVMAIGHAIKIGGVG